MALYLGPDQYRPNNNDNDDFHTPIESIDDDQPKYLGHSWVEKAVINYYQSGVDSPDLWRAIAAQPEIINQPKLFPLDSDKETFDRLRESLYQTASQIGIPLPDFKADITSLETPSIYPGILSDF